MIRFTYPALPNLLRSCGSVLHLVIGFGVRCLWSHQALVAENLFLRRQLALYQERQTRPRRANNPTRLCLVLLSRIFAWHEALVVVTPETLLRWHRVGFRLFWRWKSRGGRPILPAEVRRLIAQMARENPRWGEERMAHELQLKVGLRVAPRTVSKYMPPRPQGPPSTRASVQRWTTFVRNHAQATVACDFFIAVTASFRLLYVFVVMEVASRRIVHYNVTPNPTAQWTLQQLREAVPSDHEYRWVIHDRDSIYSPELDASVRRFRLRVLKTPPRAPQTNAYCERLIGTIRRECTDHVIPVGERHLRQILKEWIGFYNGARPHSSLGPGIPNPPPDLPSELQLHRHEIPEGSRVASFPVLGGLHHDYRLERIAAFYVEGCCQAPDG